MVRAEAGTVTMAPGAGHAERGRLLLIAGGAVFAVALASYLTAIATHPANAMLKGFDLQVYLDGGKIARHSPGTLYTWQQQRGIQFTYTPFAAAVFAVLSLAPWRVVEDAFAAAGIAALVAVVWIAFRSLGWRELRARAGMTLLVAGVSLWLEPVQRALFLGQVELLLMALVLWDMCQPPGRRLRGLAVGLATGFKLTPVAFILYLFLTRQFRAAAVACGGFAASVLAGFVFLPHASVQCYLHAYCAKAGRTGFVGFGGNQALLGTVTRLAGSVSHGRPLWLVCDLIVGIAGLAAAIVLHRAGREFEGLMTCAVTALLTSPISWDHHWVWIAPFLAVLVHWAVRAAGLVSAGLWALVAALVAGFFEWPEFWNRGAGLLQGGLIWYGPASDFAVGDNPKFPEYHWHGLQLLAGNLYVIAGCLLLAIALCWALLLTGRART